MNMVTLELNR